MKICARKIWLGFMAVLFAVSVMWIPAQTAHAAQSGYILGTNNQVTWTYDSLTKTTVISGSATRPVGGDYRLQPIPLETEHIRFENCHLRGSMSNLFYCLYNLKDINFSGLTTYNVTDMSGMFYCCDSLVSLDLTGLRTTGVTDMSSMFCNCSSLTGLNIANFDTTSVTNMKSMFAGCSSLTSLNVSSFHTENVTSMKDMFFTCSALTALDVTNFRTQNVTDMSGMFRNCKGLTVLNISIFDASKANMDYMFTSCDQLNALAAPGMMGSGQCELPKTFNAPDGQEVKILTSAYAGKILTVRGKLTATNNGYLFYLEGNGNVRCYDAQGQMVINKFMCDGVYTYYFQTDGTAMRDRLTYHPDGKHVIYLDEKGHEVFNNFHLIKKSIAGKDVDDLCFFDANGYMYVDVMTYDTSGKKIYYVNPYGVIERSGWFEFSDTAVWAMTTNKVGKGLGYALQDGVLLVNQYAKDPKGKTCYLQANGHAAY